MRNFTGYWDQDLALMYSYLEDMEIVSGTDRQKMYKMKKRDGGSALFGHTWKKYLSPTKNRPPSKKFKNLFETKLLTDHPYMEKVFQEFSKVWFPSFKWTQIQINKNFPAPKHLDSSNCGESILVCMGLYEGGGLNVYMDGEDKKPIYFDPRVKPLMFDGSKYYHEVTSFKLEEGYNRYSLVFFNNIKNLDKKTLPRPSFEPFYPTDEDIEEEESVNITKEELTLISDLYKHDKKTDIDTRIKELQKYGSEKLKKELDKIKKADLK